MSAGDEARVRRTFPAPPSSRRHLFLALVRALIQPLHLRRLNPSVLTYDVATERARAPHSAGSWGPEQTPDIVELDLWQRPLDRQPETPPSWQTLCRLPAPPSASESPRSARPTEAPRQSRQPYPCARPRSQPPPVVYRSEADRASAAVRAGPSSSRFSPKNSARPWPGRRERQIRLSSMARRPRLRQAWPVGQRRPAEAV